MRRRLWLRRALWIVFALVLAVAGLSGLIRTSAARRFLTARLESAFGRPVEVGSFDFTVLGMPGIVANGITVGEDPQFGYEYFLRAERLSVGIRWRALLLGRLEFGTLTFVRPSLNLVRLPDGRWNLESLLPPLVAVPPIPRPPGLPAPAPRFRRIEIEGGRINLKRGPEKHPFALIEVTGSIEQQSAGNWLLDLEAQPARAGVTLQEPGTLRMRGRIGGAAARLQPADLLFTWEKVSLADALRLARGSDFGVRGQLALQLNVRSMDSPEDRLRAGAARWALRGSARIERVHRWDFPERPANPALNLSLLAVVRPGDSVLDLFEGSLDAPRSTLQLGGRVSWARGIDPDLRLSSTAISLPDLLEWYRAFHSGVADDLAVEGAARLDLHASGWPLRLRQGNLSSPGASLRAASLPGPVGVGRLSIRASAGVLELAPLNLDLPNLLAAAALPTPSPASSANSKSSPATRTPPPGLLRWRSSLGDTLRFEGALRLPGQFSSPSDTSTGAWPFKLQLTGQCSRAQDVMALAAALGQPVGIGWSIEGRAELKLGWQGTVRPWSVVTAGSVDLRGVELRTALADQPVQLRAARVEINPGGSRMALKDGRALGTEWKGTISEIRTPAGENSAWEFDLSGRRLDISGLNRWLASRPSPGFLQRISPFGQPDRASAERDAALDRLQARGRLRIDEFVLAPVSVRRLDAHVELAGRKLHLRQAKGEFYGGSLLAALDAEFSGPPAYRFDGQFSRVNLPLLAADTASLKGRLAGEASGALTLAARGATRDDLVGSLAGSGRFQVRGAQLRGFTLAATPRRGRAAPGSMPFHVDAGFSVGERQLRFHQLLLREGENQFEADGLAGFARALDLNLRRVPSRRRSVSPSLAGENFRLTGTLDAPVLTAVPPSIPPAAKARRSAAASTP